MKNFLYFALIAAFLFGCAGDDDAKFSGITKTDENGTIRQNDPDDWRPWQYIGKGSVPSGVLSGEKLSFSVDTIPLADPTFQMGCYPNPCTDGTNLSFNSLEEAIYTFELYDKPGHLKRSYQPHVLKAGFYTFTFDLPHFADDMKTVLFPDGIYRLYVKRYTSAGSIYQTYGDIQIDRKGY